MELSDVHVRVLFDFEYSTKDGIEVRIKEGEKLYLIKKTNKDWWQVIRNSGRPFYVPASYIEEIPRQSELSKVDEPKNVALASYRMRSCSVESQQSHENHKMKPAVPKRTIFDISTKRVPSPRESLGLSRVTRSCDIDENDVVYVNIGKQNIENDSDLPLVDTIDENHLEVSRNVDKLLENISNNLKSVDDDFSNGYSQVSVRSCSLSPQTNEIELNNLSNSLEELTQEIELKTKCIGSQKSNFAYSKRDELVKSISKDISVPEKNINKDSLNFSLKQINESPKKLDKLQYSGSFKTKHECEKWAKNYMLLSSMREEDTVADIDKKVDKGGKKFNDDNNNVNAKQTNKTQPVAEIPKSDSIESMDSGDLVSSEKADSRASAITTSINDANDEIQCLKSNLNSSIEDFDANSSYVNSRFSLSDKGSTDSLLDVENNLGIQGESICTTASDSILQMSDTSEECLSTVLREESVEEKLQQKKKAALKRSSRVECRVRYPMRGGSPPVPEESQQPTRELFAGWCEYAFGDGRTFFYNSETGEKSWKPPRRRCNTDEKGNRITDSTNNLYSGSSSPLAEGDDSVTSAENSDIIVPEGWRLENDHENGCQCYINTATGAKWFSSSDNEGRVYYFAENSSESSWTLPTIMTTSNEKLEEQVASLTESRIYSNLPGLTRSATGIVTPNENSLSLEDISSTNRIVKSKSMILVENKNEDSPVSFSLKNWPQLSDGRMCILKEGTLNKTKITENGKRVRKNWSTSHVVLTELFLLFYKDAKSFNVTQKPGAAGRPEMSVDLNGALIDKGDRVSSRKNVYMISTVLGLQVLIQNDCVQQAENWLLAIQSAIKNLPSAFDSCPRFLLSTEEVVPESESKKFYKVTRSKSIKAKNKDGSIEDLTVNPAERQTKIKARLKKFFHRRPTMESLVKKGIYKDEPAFGCYLEHVVTNESPKVPFFVQRCIGCIERSEENMKTDGLYRASGNLSQVQKIRLQVDQNNLSVIEEEEDVHVLTGALKLFFRELKEPLIPYHLFHKAIKASHNYNKKEKISQFREITRALPTANYDTLKFLLLHLLKVTKYKEYNRMHIPNLAIVFGPTLMWSEQESSNMALDLMQQNLVIECLLVDYDNIFR